jgi:pimeloyl-ACP methyl ester carboxylesterase
MTPQRSIQFRRRLFVLSIFGLLLLPPPDAAAQALGAATVWTAPPVVHYRTVIRDSEEHRSEPNFTVFIELPDGSAGDIDPATITLNGLGALTENTAVGDANKNGIPDLTIKASRGVLVTGDGLLTVTGRTATGASFSGQTSVQLLCLPTSVEREDYFLEFTTSNMPDARLNGLPAKLEVRRVKPVFPTNCPNISPIRALVLVHGQTVPGTTVFDLQFQDYSLMERLAMRGIDTFTFNHLGFGFSAILNDNPLENPCNASLPECAVPPGGTCTPSASCDCRGGLGPNYKTDQQGSLAYLNPNPLAGRCAHTSSTSFETVTQQVEQLDLVVKDVLTRTRLEKAYLLGLSLGGSVMGKYLGVDVSHQDNVAGAIFLASTFRGAGVPSPTWPLGLINRADVAANFTLNPLTPACPGQQPAGIVDELWRTTQASDPLGATWGPAGLSRYPIVPRFGWDDGVTTRIQIPALVMNGLRDNVVIQTRSVQIFNSSPEQTPIVEWTNGAQCDAGYAFKPWPPGSDPALPTRCRLDNRTLVQLPCATHGLLWETCSGDGCVDPHKTVQKRIGDWILTGK